MVEPGRYVHYKGNEYEVVGVDGPVPRFRHVPPPEGAAAGADTESKPDSGI
jgi:hypothetical protein